MAIGISQITLYVKDQEAARRFWSEQMGFDVVMDQSYGDERWVEVAPAGGGPRLVLYKESADWPSLSGEQPNYVLFEADDLVKTHEELAGRGVEFVTEPKQEPWGWSSTFKDNEGHLFHLGQRR
ncbi:VOC family protein [Nonomuraea sp. NPDC050310]|uniref:VOC family protein n=1 Tax=unclassified Nonomuraea TaxID=2593643 RepID=UPI0033F4D942